MAQLEQIAPQARIRHQASQYTSLVEKRPSSSVIDDPGSHNDQVIDASFGRRRGGKLVWEGTMTKWQHRGKPGIGWLPVKERPDMEAFLREQGKSAA